MPMIARAIRFCIPHKILLLSLGGVSLALGIVGAFIPVMPSMVFLLIALWAFSKGSERFHTWLYEHRFFGPPLQDWCQHRVVAPRAKIVGVGGMAFSCAIITVMFPLGSAVTVNVMSWRVDLLPTLATNPRG